MVMGLQRRIRNWIAGREWDCTPRVVGAVSQERAADTLRRYQLLAEHGRDIILFIRPSDGRILEANKSAQAAYGYSREELLGLTIHQLRAPESREAVARQMATADDQGIRFEAFHQRKDGTTFPVEVNSQGATLGDARMLVSVIRDITDRRRAEERLRESEECFRLAVEYTPAAVAMFDRQMRYMLVSRRFVTDYRLAEQDLVGRSHYDVFPELSERVREVHRRCLAGAVEKCEEDPFPRPDGTLDWVRWEVHPWRDAAGEIGGILLFSEIITERKQAEELLRRAQKLESIGRLAGGVAHDFNNLLTVILSCCETLKERVTAVAPGGLEEVEEIRSAGERARDLTRQLLAFARKQIIVPVPLDLNSTVSSCEKLLRRVLGEDIKLVVQLQADLWPVFCDPGQVEQVLINLAANARDAMPGGGTLTVTTGNASVEPAEADRSPESRVGEWVRLIVRDTGSGMSTEVKKHAFEPFFTTKGIGHGTGLGLATVHGIVAQSRGHIRLESGPGQGTTFEICLPRATGTPVSARTVVPTTVAGGGETILVIEDSLPVRVVTVRALQFAGYHVLTACDGAEALSVALQRPDPIDLVVTDVVMPGMSGPEIVEELQRRRPNLRALYVSGYTGDAVARRGVLEAGDRFLPKPFTRDSLLARVRAILDER